MYWLKTSGNQNIFKKMHHATCLKFSCRTRDIQLIREIFPTILGVSPHSQKRKYRLESFIGKSLSSKGLLMQFGQLPRRSMDF
jgi:hypothetical protein